MLLAVEVVSPGVKNRHRDYVEKLKEYQTRKISEYWIVDPQEEKISVFILEEELFYSEPTMFTNGFVLTSPKLDTLNLTLTCGEVLEAML